MSALSDCGVKVALQEELAGGGEICQHSHGIDHRHSPEGAVVAKMLGNESAEQYADSYANIPRNQNGAVGSAALVVVRHAENHVLERGPHVAVP